MLIKRNLQYRISHRKHQNQDQSRRPLEPRVSLLDRIIRISEMNPSSSLQTPNHLTEMNSLQGLPLSNIQGPTETFSSAAIPWSKHTERGRSLRRKSTGRFKPNLLKRLEMTEPERTQLLDRSLQPSRTMMQNSEPLQAREEPSLQRSAPPALLLRIQMNDNPMMSLSPKSSRLMSQPMRGSQERRRNVHSYEKHSRRRSSSSRLTPLIRNQPNVPLSTNRIAQSSRTRSGRTSSLDELSTLMPYSVDSSPLPRMNLKSRSLEILRSPSEQSSPQRWSRMEEIGPLHGTGQSELPCSLSLTGSKNSRVTGSTSSICSQSPTLASTAGLSPLTKLSGRELGASGTLNYRTSRNSRILRSRTWIRSGYRLSRGRLVKKMEGRKESVEKVGRKTSPVINGMTESAAKRKKTADECMSATNAGSVDIRERSVERRLEPKRPKYIQRSVWTDGESAASFSPTAASTLCESPLPRPSPEEFSNVDAMNTIRDNPHLFKIVTPIDVAQLERLLESHPNKPFVQSVCVSFREGFWPWANTQKEEYPTTWDYSN